MMELVADNIAQLEAMHGYPPLLVVRAARAQLRDISLLTTWCYCVLGFIAIRTADPTMRDQLAYAHLIIIKALCSEGVNWLDYDRVFHQ